MKALLLSLTLIGAISARGQVLVDPAAVPATSGPTTSDSTTSAPVKSAAAGVTLPDETGTLRLYPTNLAEVEKTTRAGILHLTAADIPRYTQTGPVPIPAPARLGVLSPIPHDPALPTLWTIGDSTVRTGVHGTGEDRPGQWGWGAPLVAYFDAKKINVTNRAVGGTTSGSFYLGQWKAMVGLIKKNDVVILQFGTNSGGVELGGTGDESQTRNGRDGKPALSHSFGWYLRQFIGETRAKGATPVICSLIPRNAREADGKIRRSAKTQAGWAREVAAAEGADFIDLNELVARKYDAMAKVEVDTLFAGSPHTSWTGAVVNAETVISGLKALKTDPVAAYYIDQVSKIPAAPTLTYSLPATEPLTGFLK